MPQPDPPLTPVALRTAASWKVATTLQCCKLQAASTRVAHPTGLSRGQTQDSTAFVHATGRWGGRAGETWTGEALGRVVGNLSSPLSHRAPFPFALWLPGTVIVWAVLS